MKTAEQLDTYHASEATRAKSKRAVNLFWIIAMVFLLILSGYLLMDTLSIGGSSAKNAYDKAQENAQKQTYRTIYDYVYDLTYPKYLVKNQATISVDKLREESKLEVLEVNDAIYEIAGNDGPKDKNLLTNLLGIVNGSPTVWLEIPGKSTYTVNMKLAEFIVDDSSHYVLIRIPKPEPDEASIYAPDIKLLYSKEGGFFRNSVKDGVDLVNGSISDAQLRIRLDIENNQMFAKSAEESARSVLTGLVKKLNTDIPDLTVEIEFIND